MDSVPDKVALKISCTINENIINTDLLTKKDKKLLVDIEGNLQICMGNRVFFSDDNILLLEFGVEVTKWITDFFPDKDFNYYTMSHDESILRFIRQSDGWFFWSPWQEFQVDFFISNDVLKDELRKYLREFEEQLREKYNLTIYDFL